MCLLSLVLGFTTGILTSTPEDTQPSLYIGNPAYAAGSADYYSDGTDDDVQFQQALDALPATGGRLIVYTGNYSFSNTVSRAIDNVLIQGVGMAAYLAYDGVNPLFDVGIQSGWVFRNIRFDAGGIDVSGAPTTTKVNVQEGGTFVGLQSRGNILPAADDTYQLGAVGIEWTALHISGLSVTGGVLTVEGIGDGGLTNYDIKIGDTTTPDYGMLQFGNAVMGRTSYNVANVDLDGAVIFRNLGGPVTGQIEFL